MFNSIHEDRNIQAVGFDNTLAVDSAQILDNIAVDIVADNIQVVARQDVADSIVAVDSIEVERLVGAVLQVEVVADIDNLADIEDIAGMVAEMVDFDFGGCLVFYLALFHAFFLNCLKLYCYF